MNYEFTSNIKSWAVISIIAAHVYIDGHINLGLEYFKIFLNYFGTIGVGLFFMVSGFLWGKRGSNLKKSSSKLIIPWVVSGSCIFAYVYLRKVDLDSGIFYSYFSFILGQSSYLYYMSVYFIFLLTARFWKDDYFGFSFFIVSLIYYAFQIPFFHIYLGVNEHLNPLLWFPYIYIGKYAATFLLLVDVLKIRIILVLGLLILALSYYYCEYNIKNHIAYFSIFRIFLTIYFFIFLYYLSINFDYLNRFNIIGEQSLFVYLWHMPLIGILNFIANNFFEEVHYFSIPIIMLFFMLLIRVLSNRKSSFYPLIGFRGSNE
jgi:hypothetical protein